MEPLTVTYYPRSTPRAEPGLLRIDRAALLHMDDLQSKINGHVVNRVALLGPAVCSGWRLLVRRPVQFVSSWEVGGDDHYRHEEVQARVRILGVFERSGL